MIQNISLLDCTLRDGCHINGGYFGKRAIIEIIENLVQANVDIIEVGFFDNGVHDEDSSYFSSIAEARKILPKNKGKSHFCLMADFVDVSDVDPCDGTIEFFRLSFKRHRWDWAIDAAKKLIAKGYKVYINPVNCNVYTDEEYISCIKRVNELKPYGFSIVDTFGVLRKQDLSRIYYMVEGNLDKDIVLGLHLHENLGLAYTLAQHFLEIRSPRRKISIDGSLLGMGRAPGNLCIDQIIDHLNNNFGADYNLEPAFDAIDNYIAPIKREKPWGYAIAYALSGKYGLHRTYAEYLMEKNRLKTKDIQRILSQVDRDHIEMFDEDYIENLYRRYMSSSYDDSNTMNTLRSAIENRTVLVICPGSSISRYRNDILRFVNENDAVVISVNFVPEFIQPDIAFCANAKRIVNIRGSKNVLRIVTSNLKEDAAEYCEGIVSYNECVYFNETFCEDSTLMLLKTLERADHAEVYIAGFDGFRNGGADYYSEHYTREEGKNVSVKTVQGILHSALNRMKIHFLTPSVYEKEQKDD